MALSRELEHRSADVVPFPRRPQLDPQQQAAEQDAYWAHQITAAFELTGSSFRFGSAVSLPDISLAELRKDHLTTDIMSQIHREEGMIEEGQETQPYEGDYNTN